MKIFHKLNFWFSKRIRNVEDTYLIDSVFVYFLLDIFSWSFSFDEDKMLDLLNFLRKENAKPSGASTTQVQNYAEGEFDLVLGAYEARCLLHYVDLVGGDQCLLLPYPEETPQRTWCSQLDRIGLKELHRAQHKKKQLIKKRHIKEYRSIVRKQRVTATCNVRILNRKKPPVAPEHPLPGLGVDHVYEFSSFMTKTPDSDENYDLMQKTQSVIDSIKRLNYLSDSATGSDFSLGSRPSEDDGESLCSSVGIFGDSGSFVNSNNQNHDSHVEVVEMNEEFQGTGTTVASFTSTAQPSVPLQRSEMPT